MFKFVKISASGRVTLFMLEEESKGNYSHYHAMMKSLNSSGYSDLRNMSKLSRVYGATGLNNSEVNKFTNILLI